MFLNIFLLRPSIQTRFSSQFTNHRFENRTMRSNGFRRPASNSQGSFMRKRVQQCLVRWRSLVVAAIWGAFAVGFVALPVLSGEVSVAREYVPVGPDQVNEPTNP